VSVTCLPRFSVPFVPSFIAPARAFVAKAFSGGRAGLLFLSVRSSNQLWDVAGSLWGRPHFFPHRPGKEAACFAGAVFVR